MGPGKAGSYGAPHVWAKFDCSVETLAKNYSSNHAHAVPGDYVGELIAICNTLGVEPIVLS